MVDDDCSSGGEKRKSMAVQEMGLQQTDALVGPSTCLLTVGGSNNWSRGVVTELDEIAWCFIDSKMGKYNVAALRKHLRS